MENEKLGYVDNLRTEALKIRKDFDSVTLTVNLDFKSNSFSKIISLDFPINPPLTDFNLYEKWSSKVSLEIKNIFQEYINAESAVDNNDTIAIGLKNDIMEDGVIKFNNLNVSEGIDHSLSVETVNSKFQMAVGANIGTFGDPSLFLKGLDDLIGLPDFKIDSAIMNEHCFSADSYDDFITSNYGGTITNSAVEYEFVHHPVANKIYPGSTNERSKRRVHLLQNYLEHPMSIRAKLSQAEIIAIRLFTGPMYMKYNAILRGYPTSMIESLKGNRYTTTIHAIVSGIIKLSQIAELPESRKVYRGLGGMILPEKFWKPDEFGCKGGVEYGFMSTTTERDVAIMYSGKANQLCTVFEIDVGQIDRGASIQWLSQYPQENEFLVPPLSNLEVIGKPHIEKTSKGDILVMKLRINVNFKSKTLDELVATRKRLHISTMENLLSDLKRELGIENNAHPILQSFNNLLKQENAKPADWFNNDHNYRECQEKMMDMKIGTIKQNYILNFAKRLLTGDRCNEFNDKSNQLKINEMKMLEEYYSKLSIINNQFVEEDYDKLRSVISRCIDKKITFQSKTKTFIGIPPNESYQIITQLLSIFSKYSRIIESEKPVSWVTLYETKKKLRHEVEEINKITCENFAIYEEGRKAIAADKEISHQQAIGNRIAQREKDALKTLDDVLVSQIATIRDLISSKSVLDAILLEEDDITLGELPSISSEILRTPWILSSNFGPLSTNKMNKIPELSKSFENYHKIRKISSRFHNCHDEIRCRLEKNWLESQITVITTNKSEWIQKYSKKLTSRGKLPLKLDLKELKSQIDSLQQSDNKNQALLISEIELRVQEFESNHMEEIDAIVSKEVIEMITNTYSNNTQLSMKEMYFYYRKLLAVVREKDRLLRIKADSQNINNIEKKDDVETTREQEILSLITVVNNDTIARCQEYLKLQEKHQQSKETRLYDITNATKSDVSSSASVALPEFLQSVPYIDSSPFDEMAASENLRANLGRARGEGLLYLTWSYLDLEFALESLAVYAEDSPRMSKEVIKLYQNLSASMDYLKKQEIHGDHTPEFILEIHKLSLDTIQRADVYDRINVLNLLVLSIESVLSGNILEKGLAVDEINEKQCYHLLAKELDWRGLCRRYLRADPDYHLLRTLERRKCYGVGGDGRGGNLSIQEVVIDKIAKFNTEKFARTDFTNRLEGAVRLLSIACDDEDLIWMNDFDLEAVCVDASTIISCCRDEKTNTCPLYPAHQRNHNRIFKFPDTFPTAALEQNIINEKALDKQYGAQRIEHFLGVDPQPRRVAARAGGWPDPEPTQLDESRYAKELLWVLRTKYRNKEDFSEQNKLLRKSTFRLLEITAALFSNLDKLEIELSDVSVGMGGESIQDAWALINNTTKTIPADIAIEDKNSQIYKHRNQVLLWFGALSIHFDRVGPFQLKQISGNKVSEVHFPSLTISESQYLIGFGFFCNTKVKFKVGDDKKSAVTLQDMNPYSNVHRGICSDEITVNFGFEMMIIMLQILNCHEIALLPTDKRWHTMDFSVESVGNIIKPEKLQLHALDFKKITVTTDLNKMSCIEVLSDILTQFPGIEWITMQFCNLGDEQITALLPSFDTCKDKLKYVYLGYNVLGDEGAVAIAESTPKWGNVKSISVANNQIRNRGAIALINACTVNHSINKILLRDNLIGYDGAAAIAAMLDNTKLDELDMGSNKLGEAGQDILYQEWTKSRRAFRLKV